MSIPDCNSFSTHIIGCLYNRSPTCHINEFSDWFKLVLSNVYSVNVTIPITIMGDFNFPYINWAVPTSMYNDVYDNLMLTYTNQLGFSQGVNFPTRLANTLDLVLTNIPDRLHSMTTLPPFSNSDHDTISFTLFTGTSLPVIHRPNFAAIDLALRSIDWDVLFINCQSVQQLWNTFVHKLDSFILKFVPRVKGASYVVRKSPWLPLAVRRAIAAKAAAWRQW